MSVKWASIAQCAERPFGSAPIRVVLQKAVTSRGESQYITRDDGVSGYFKLLVRADNNHFLEHFESDGGMDMSMPCDVHLPLWFRGLLDTPVRRMDIVDANPHVHVTQELEWTIYTLVAKASGADVPDYCADYERWKWQIRYLSQAPFSAEYVAYAGENTSDRNEERLAAARAMAVDPEMLRFRPLLQNR